MTRFVYAWRTWGLLSKQERSLWIQAWFLLPVVSISLRLFGLGWVQACLGNITSKRPERTDISASISLARIFHRAVRWSLLPASCLARSLVLCWLLRKQGLQADLRIGVAKLDGHFAAHAWVEHGGVTLEEEKIHHQFAAFDRIVFTSDDKSL